jgi:hypothetical protein
MTYLEGLLGMNRQPENLTSVCCACNSESWVATGQTSYTVKASTTVVSFASAITILLL